jgi:putative flippase GtrA
MSWRENPASARPDRAGRHEWVNAMILIDTLKATFPRIAALVAPHVDLLRKAISFGLIGVVNVGVDFLVFLALYTYLSSHREALRPLEELAQWWPSGSIDVVALIPNVSAWAVAVSGSYVMNSFITFAAESGRQLRWKDYRKFVAAGIPGVIASSTTLLIAMKVMPVLPAKGCAILVAFTVNFSMSHFVVFRPQRAVRESAEGAAAAE